jgi:hypothetical protein
MTEEKFKQIKELQDKIENKERKIRNIDLLISSYGLGCKITGTPKGTFRQAPEHYFSNKEEIIKILQLDREKIINELIELKKVFSEH